MKPKTNRSLKAINEKDYRWKTSSHKLIKTTELLSEIMDIIT